MRPKRHNNNNSRGFRQNNRGGGKYRSGGGGYDSQSLARQKKHAMTQKEKYIGLARDAQVNGERVDAEYYYQHVEHYSRMIGEIMVKEAQHEDKSSGQRDVANDNDSDTENDGDAYAVANEQNDEAAEDADVQAEEKTEQTARAKPRRKSAAKKSPAKGEDIPLPSSILPEAEPLEQAAAQ